MSRFRVTLSHDVIGSQVINEPDGWKDAVMKLERDKEGDSLIEHYVGGSDSSFIFYGDNGIINGGINFLLQAEQYYGLDAEVNALFEYSDQEDDVFEQIFTGQVDISQKTHMKDNKMQAPIIRDDFWATFINRMDTPVDLQSTTDLDGNAVAAIDPVTINLTSQKIQKQFDGTLSTGATVYQDDILVNEYLQFDFDNEILSEIETKYNLFFSSNPDRPVALFEIKEAGDYAFDIRIEMTIKLHTGGAISACAGLFISNPTSSYMNVYLQINDNTPIALTETDFSGDSTAYTYTGTQSLTVGSNIRIYAIVTDVTWKDANAANSILIYGDVNTSVPIKTGTFSFNGVSCVLDSVADDNVSFSVPSGSSTPTYLSITAQTTIPATETEGFLLHDAFAAVCARIGLGNNSFYSEYLGSELTEARTYAENGCGSEYVVLKGLQIRQYTLTEKPFFTSFKQLWQGANPILCLGFGYDTIGDTKVVRIEDKPFYYDSTDTSVEFSNVREIASSYDEERIFKTIKNGYKIWQSEDISGIDDPQTKQTRATRLKKAGKEIVLESEFIAASLAIETTRRTTREKSADYKYDNNTFIIAVYHNEGTFLPKTNGDFNSITNLLNSDTRYNSILTCLRNFLRWTPYFNGGLYQYQTSKYKFVSGEGNYDMVSDYDCSVGRACEGILCDSFAEKADINLATYFNGLGYLFIPVEHTIIINMNWDQYLTIRQNPTLAIGISQTSSNFTKFFIKELEFSIVKGKATIKAWPKTPFTIQVIQ